MKQLTTWHRAGAAVLGVALAGPLAACGSDETDDKGALRLAVTDLQGLEELQREFGAFKTTFEKVSGMELDFIPVSDRTAAAAALEGGDIDLVFTGPSEYVVIHERTDAEPVVAIERDGYRSCIYTSTESGVSSLEDLRGEKIAMSDIGSTSGHLGPSQMLLEAGLDPQDDLEVLTVGDAVHAALERGDVKAVGVGCHDYEEFMAEADPEDFPMVAEGEVLPPDVIVARSGLDEDTVEAVQQAFADHFDELLESILEGKDYAKYENAKLAQVTDEDYDVVRSMFQAIGVDDFTEFVG